MRIPRLRVVSTSKERTMSQIDEARKEEAAAWFIRLRDPATADWEGFTAWLERDPANNGAYEAVALADDDYASLVEQAAPPQPSNDNPAGEPRRLGRVAGWATAAAAVMVAAVSYPLLTGAPATYAVETAAGQRNTIRLDDGTRIDINGDSKVTLRKDDNRFASLDRGEATFTVTHDAKNPFAVKVGDDVIQDVGTVFNIVRDAGGMETAVSSGAVVYNPEGEAVRVAAGQVLRLSADGKTVTVGTVAPADVAAWRKDRLVYDNVTLARVAADLSRNLGTPVRISPDIAARPFSGVILLGGDQAALLPRIGAMLDVTITHEVDGWRLSSHAGDGR
ncbi:iron dicitrate transport regulator FecR [Rhizorhabdus wittichii DC-6]|jgi:transmembrane sensor|nr:iron dicitrate transport regulator FecR [Rhizorhabdus wittichii DC-6]